MEAPKSSPQPRILSPGSCLSLRDKEFVWIHFTCTPKVCHVSQLGQVHSSIILLNPQQGSASTISSQETEAWIVCIFQFTASEALACS